VSVNKVMFPDGTEIDANGATCEACGESLANHGCSSSGSGAPVTVVTTRSYGPRKRVEERESCPHCRGVRHFNMGASAVNAECLNRQFSVDVGEIASPNDRLPVMTLDRMERIVAWGKALTTPPSYGKMESAAGGAATYSAARPKTGRKKKAVAAAAGERIEDIAGSVEAPAPKGKKSASSGKGRRSKNGSAASSSAAPALDTASDSAEPSEAVAEAEQIVRSKGKSKKAPASESPNGAAAPDAPFESIESEADKRRRERQERRKALLAQRS
jgi:hypothetical protein